MWYKIKKIYLWEDLVWPKPAAPVSTIWIYWNQSLWLISIVGTITDWAPDPGWTITIADKNVWATTAWTYWSAVNASNVGGYFQRWNNYAFPYNSLASITTSSTLVNASAYSWSNPYSSSTYGIGWQYDWTSDHNHNLRWWEEWQTYARQKWPCDTWWHIPRQAERQTVLSLWQARSWRWSGSWDWQAISQAMLLPPGWYYSVNSWNLVYEMNGSGGYYWCCTDWWTASAQTGWWLGFSTNYMCNAYYPKVNWYNIRPFKNSVVTPDASWVKLWPNS